MGGGETIMSFDSITIGSQRVRRMDYDQVKPGDFVCTYEALTTRPDLRIFQSLMSRIGLFYRPELNKMFHTEIIVDKYSRKGIYQIAHADGGIRKIVLQNDNFKEHHPGQAFLVFRAKNKLLQKEVVSVAKKTAEPNNGHRCKTLQLDSVIYRTSYLLNFFVFENFGKRASSKILRTISCIAVNYEQFGRFYSRNGTGSQEMRCVEYVANVINVATIRVLSKSSSVDSKRLRKIDTVFNQLRQWNIAGGLPLKFSSSYAMAPEFVNFFLQNQPLFETVGYLGAISEKMEGPALDIRGRGIRIVASDMRQLFPEEMSSAFAYAVSVMKVLGMLSDSSELYLKVAGDLAKIKTLFVSIYAYIYRLALKIDSFPDSKKLEELSSSFLSKVNLLAEESLQERKENRSQTPLKIDSLDYGKAKQILGLEKEFLKLSILERTEKTLKLSMNVLATEQLEIDRSKAIAERMFRIANGFGRTFFFSVFRWFFSRIGGVFCQRADRREKSSERLRCEILTVHERIRKNGRITLITEGFGKEGRPWIRYSIDEGTLWDVEPFKREGGLWYAEICMPERSGINYRLFIGPEGVDDLDPVGKAIAWQQIGAKETVFVSSEAMHQRSSYLEIDRCLHPQWVTKLIIPIEGAKMGAYQADCRRIACSENWPLSIQKYEDNFTELESNFKLINLSVLQNKEEMVFHIQEFLETELQIKALPEQIQFMKGGLGKGLSGDRIYKIFDKENTPYCVVKVFMKSKGKCLREFFSLMNHSTLNLKLLNLPMVMGVGASEFENRKVFFLATHYVQGTSVYDMFMTLLSHKEGSVERQKALKRLLHVYVKLAEGIAEYHRLSRGFSRSLHPTFVNLLNAFSKNAFIKFQGQLEPQFLKALQDFFEKALPLESQKQFICGYQHGDINGGNLIYNSGKDQLSLIDWPDGSFSIGQDGASMGRSFYDLIQIRHELLIKKTQGATEEEVAALDEVFMEKYTAEGGVLPSDETMKFFSCVDLMGSLKWFLDKKHMFEGEELNAAEKMYHAKLTQLAALIYARE